MSTVHLLLLPLVVALVRCSAVNADDQQDSNASDVQPDVTGDSDESDEVPARTPTSSDTKTRSRSKTRSKTRSRTSTQKPSPTAPAHGPIIQPVAGTLTDSGSSIQTPALPALPRPTSRRPVAGTVLGALFGAIAGIILVVFVLRWYSIWTRRRRQQQRNGSQLPTTRQIQGQWVSGPTAAGRESASPTEPPPPYHSAPAYDATQAAAPFSYTAGPTQTPR